MLSASKLLFVLKIRKMQFINTLTSKHIFYDEHFNICKICNIYIYIYIYIFSAVKWLTVINCIQNNYIIFFTLWVPFIYYVYKYTHTVYFLKINVYTCIYLYYYVILYINIFNISHIFLKYMHACLYFYIHNKYTQYTLIYFVNKNFYFGCD